MQAHYLGRQRGLICKDEAHQIELRLVVEPGAAAFQGAGMVLLQCVSRPFLRSALKALRPMRIEGSVSTIPFT